MDWRLVGIVSAVLVACLGVLTVLSLMAGLPAAVVGSSVTTVIGFVAGWVQPQPRKF